MRAGDIQVRVQAAAIKDRQGQPGGDAHLLGRVAEQIAEMQSILLQEGHQVDIRIKRGFRGINFA